MKSLMVAFLFMGSVFCEVFIEERDLNYQEPIPLPLPLLRERRQVYAKGSHEIAGGKVFGELGQNGDAVFGRGGYEKNIFDNDRGKLDAQIYGTRVIMPDVSGNLAGGRLNYNNQHVDAMLDVNRVVGGRPNTELNAAVGTHWPVGKNGEVSAQGTYKTDFHGRNDYGGLVSYKHRF